MKILITGASGLLGSKLCEIAMKREHEVYSVYKKHKPLHGTLIKFDIADKKAIERTLEKLKPEAVVHAAALTNVDRCESEKELAWKVNAKGTEEVATACKKHHAFLVYVSTDYVFDGEKGMYEENEKPTPINYYGFTKLMGEDSVRSLMDTYCITRASVIYGSIPATGKVNFALWLLEKLKGEEETKIVTDQWNSPTLNTNLARMLLEILERKITGIYHLAGATRISRYEFAKLIAETFHLDTSLITPISSKELSWIAKRPKDSSLSVNKACQTLINKPLKVSKALEAMKKEMTKSVLRNTSP